jgi:hypothetical protein
VGLPRLNGTSASRLTLRSLRPRLRLRLNLWRVELDAAFALEALAVVLLEACDLVLAVLLGLVLVVLLLCDANERHKIVAVG